MTTVKPFKAIRPNKEFAAQVSCPPYDVVSETEARVLISKNPCSFMKVIRPEAAFDEDCAFAGDELYEKAEGFINEYIKEGLLEEESQESFYIYRQISNGRIQSGLVGCFAVDDYLNGNIKEHESTRKDKEEDRIRHIDICGANTGLVYLAYKEGQELKNVLNECTKAAALYDFAADDGVRHIVWKISDPDTVREIADLSGEINSYYIADGHHRSAAAAEVCKKRRAENPSYTGDEEFNYFLAVAFPYEELLILPYYRVVKDLAGLAADEFIEKISEGFTVNKLPEDYTGDENLINISRGKNEIAMYLDGSWYSLTAKEEILKHDPIGTLDVSLLQDNILGPVLGIDDPRTDKRIDFVGGVRGSKELEARCKSDMKAAFALYPTSMNELMDAADAGLYMPPKSTWFEPKLLSGLFVHRI